MACRESVRSFTILRVDSLFSLLLGGDVCILKIDYLSRVETKYCGIFLLKSKFK